MCSCAQLSHCAGWVLMATDSLASQPCRQRSWHYHSHSQTQWMCTHAVQPEQFKLMMLLFKGVMSLWRLFVSFVMFPWSLLPVLVFLPPEDIFILHGKDKKNPLIYGLFTTSRYASTPTFQKLKRIHKYTLSSISNYLNRIKEKHF